MDTAKETHKEAKNWFLELKMQNNSPQGEIHDFGIFGKVMLNPIFFPKSYKKLFGSLGPTKNIKSQNLVAMNFRG